MPLSSFQPRDYDQLLARKVTKTVGLLQRFGATTPQVFASAVDSFRMRAEFRVWHDGDALNYVMFKRGDAKTPYPIENFPIACQHIQAVMPRLRSQLADNPALRSKLFQVEFLASLSGELVITLAYHRKLDEDWEAEAVALRQLLADACETLSIIGRSRKQKLVLGNDFVEETLPVAGRNYRYQQFEQSFTQPNARVNIHMLEWASNRAAELDAGDLLELYCGNGNFTLPLARHFEHVIATEVAKSSTKAARHNIALNNVSNVELVRLSAEEVTEALGGIREFRRLRELHKPLQDYRLKTLFVDPPRAGLDAATTKMAAGFDNILYISCNPQTLAENLAALTRTHEITHFALFDQFPYTDHMECGVTLRRIGAG